MAASSKQLGIGLVGYGMSAKVFHIPYIGLSPKFALRAVLQRHSSSAKEDHPSVVVHHDMDALVQDAAVDVVVLNTPVETHFELASKALQAGKHVVVEKPFCPTSAECDKLIVLAQQKGVVLSVFQNRRWDVDFLTLQQVLASGALGRVIEFESHFDRWSPGPSAKWAGRGHQLGTDAVYDLGAHLIDQVLTLYGLPASVTGFLSAQRADSHPPTDPNDAFTVLLHYQSGLLATLKATVISAETEQLRFWVRGDQGSFRKCHMDPQEPQIIGGMKATDPGFAAEPESHYGFLTVSKDGELVKTTVPSVKPTTHAKYYDLLAEALLGNGPVPVTAKSARNVIKIIELAGKSAAEGVTVAFSE